MHRAVMRHLVVFLRQVVLPENQKITKVRACVFVLVLLCSLFSCLSLFSLTVRVCVCR